MRWQQEQFAAFVTPLRPASIPALRAPPHSHTTARRTYVQRPYLEGTSATLGLGFLADLSLKRPSLKAYVTALRELWEYVEVEDISMENDEEFDVAVSGFFM